MAITPVSTRFGHVKADVQLSINPDQLGRSLQEQIETQGKELCALREQVTQNRHAVAKLLDHFASHAAVFDSADAGSLIVLAQMTAADRRRVYSKMSKSEAWPSQETQQMSKSEFDELCTLARLLTEE
ncbi:MAG: hypothetical protein OIF40_16515 [Mangrovicoccus sp.]|nr:hypothetical protein [Mangrovicoccus sp.]